MAVAAVLGLTRLTTYLLSSSGHASVASPKSSVPAREASDAPPGRILSLTGTEYLAVSDLRGDRPTQLSSLGKFSPSPEPTLDSRYIVTPFAQLITFSLRGQPSVRRGVDPLRRTGREPGGPGLGGRRRVRRATRGDARAAIPDRLARGNSVRISTTAVRGLIHRSRATILIFLLALVGTAAATAGPAYYQAARTSILRDSLTSSSFVGQGFEATASGQLSGLLSSMAGLVQSRLGTYLGPLNGQHLFVPPVESIEASLPVGDQGSAPLVWRTDFCAHLRFQGSCPTKAGQVLVNGALAKSLGWHVGSTIADGDRVTGIYQLPSQASTYWSARYSIYFPGSSVYNAVFTQQATLYDLASTMQGTVAFDDVLAPGRVSTSDVNGLTNAMNGLTGDAELGSEFVTVTTAIPATMADVQSSWHDVAVPIALITGEVLALCLLLLFTAVTETVDGQAGDIALARLRGQGRIRTMAFGLSEPSLVLLVSLPVGVLIGWLTVRYLTGVMLRPGTPVILPFLAWAAAAGVLVAGVAAVLRAAIRAVRRPVVDHLRGSGQQLTRRGWIVDAILATAAVAGLADLIGSGRTRQSSHSTLGLLVPGLARPDRGPGRVPAAAGRLPAGIPG